MPELVHTLKGRAGQGLMKEVQNPLSLTSKAKNLQHIRIESAIKIQLE